MPVSGSEGAVHRRADVHHVVSLSDLRPHQLRLDHVDQELFNLVLPNLDAVLDLGKTDLRPGEERFIIKPRNQESNLFSASCMKLRSFIFLTLSSCLRPSPVTKSLFASKNLM